ncbi:MAG: methylated-DNA--[protein]-cysteine S-methyltransferase [Alphaproteobacteria bacterium]|nr:methylated-DNA--[protein]-cysteine S-methyltransferase [Alphaproteobacteria bacterium]
MAILTIHSPIGPLYAIDDNDKISRFGFGAAQVPDDPSPLLRQLAEMIDSYFAGQADPFDLPLAPAETPFQSKVRAAMLAIPFGETRTYGEIAHDVAGNPRAVGQACGRNPIPIIVPCHRVLGSGGWIGGFSGGDGVPTKHRLLAHEASTTFALTS